MPIETSTVAALLVAPVLLTAGVAKLAAPRAARDSFVSLAPRAESITTALSVRLVAAVETAVGLLLVLPRTRDAGALGAIAFGIAFAILGIWGQLSASSISCGCFGAGSSRPLGYKNVAIGIAVLALAVLALTGSLSTSGTATARDLDLAALLSLLITFGVFRSLLPRQLLPITGMEKLR
ncbi:MAG: hypothetical protein M3Y42_04050 [Actinomycetota bacterium]|nr:hypothetical protein [Actinomycetota bacterium]